MIKNRVIIKLDITPHELEEVMEEVRRYDHKILEIERYDDKQ